MLQDEIWYDHPDAMPMVFSLTCKNVQKVYTYNYAAFDSEFLPIARAFVWSIVRRAHAVGHETRCTLGNSIRHFQNYTKTIPPNYRPRVPADITASTLREFARWLRNDSGLNYRSAAGTFRILRPYVLQWLGQPWVSRDLAYPDFCFPHSNSSSEHELKKGYTSIEMNDIAKHVIADISAINERMRRKHIPSYLATPPPLYDVAPELSNSNPRGAKWTVLEYRIWWWENNCACEILTIAEITRKPGAHSFLYGYWQRGSSIKTIKSADARLQKFYGDIGAGPEYCPRYLNQPPPIRYNSKWQKVEYIDWYWENECDCCELPMQQLRKRHRQLVIALKEYHGGYGAFCERNGICTSIAVSDLCPYYVGLLLTTALNPTVVQRLKVDCLSQDPLCAEWESLAWIKLRANKAGLTVPAHGRATLAPANIVRSLIEFTAPYRAIGNSFLFATNGYLKSRHALNPSLFAKAIKSWFKSHGLKRTDLTNYTESMHSAVNFRPAVAKMGYEKTGSLEYVRAVLGHTRMETSVTYVGKLSDAHLTFHRGIHIHAILIGALSGSAAAKSYVRDQRSLKATPLLTPALISETMDAHCRDILNSPLRGQVKGRECSTQHACLYCANLVVTIEDIHRHFAMKNFYCKKVLNCEITEEECEHLIGERVFIFENNILQHYDPKLLDKLRLDAIQNPPPEYSDLI